MRTRWECTLCGRKGTVRHRADADSVDIAFAIERAHENAERARGRCGFDPDVFMVRTFSEARPC